MSCDAPPCSHEAQAVALRKRCEDLEQTLAAIEQGTILGAIYGRLSTLFALYSDLDRKLEDIDAKLSRNDAR